MSKKKEEPRENVIWLMDIFYKDYKFKEIFPDKHAQYIRSFHEFLRRGEQNGTVPKRKDKRWCWEIGENLDEVHRLLKERYPEVEGKEVAVARNKRVIHPKYKSSSSETRSNRATPNKATPKTPCATSIPATPCLSSPAATPKDASPEPDGEEKGINLPGSKTPRAASSPEAVPDSAAEPTSREDATTKSVTEENKKSGTEESKAPQKPAQTKNRLTVPKAKVKTSSPKRTKCEPEKDIWFPLDRSEVIKELVHIGQSVRSIAYICDMNADEVKTLIKETSPTIMGIIPESDT